MAISRSEKKVKRMIIISKSSVCLAAKAGPFRKLVDYTWSVFGRVAFESKESLKSNESNKEMNVYINNQVCI